MKQTSYAKRKRQLGDWEERGGRFGQGGALHTEATSGMPGFPHLTQEEAMRWDQLSPLEPLTWFLLTSFGEMSDFCLRFLS